MLQAIFLKNSAILVMASVFASGSPGAGAPRLQTTLKLLDEYYRETVQSVDDPGKPDALDKLRRMKPVAELLSLYAQRNEGVLRLRGEFWATVCVAVGPAAFVKPLLASLRDRDPRWRSLSAEALGALREEAAIPDLLALLGDGETVPGVAGEPTVAVFAASGLAKLGRPDGVQLLLSHAAANKHWPLMFLDDFRGLSGQDFGENLEAWKDWFRSHDAKAEKFLK